MEERKKASKKTTPDSTFTNPQRMWLFFTHSLSLYIYRTRLVNSTSFTHRYTNFLCERIYVVGWLVGNVYRYFCLMDFDGFNFGLNARATRKKRTKHQQTSYGGKMEKYRANFAHRLHLWCSCTLVALHHMQRNRLGNLCLITFH